MVFYVSDIRNGSNKVDDYMAMKRAYLVSISIYCTASQSLLG